MQHSGKTEDSRNFRTNPNISQKQRLAFRDLKYVNNLRIVILVRTRRGRVQYRLNIYVTYNC